MQFEGDFYKLARDLNLPKLKFQVIRRTIATLAQKGTVKDVQDVLRLSRTATTMGVYMQEIPESVQSKASSINRELRNSPEANGKNGRSRLQPVRWNRVVARLRNAQPRL